MTAFFIRVINKYAKDFLFFYRYLGNKLFLCLGFNIIVGFLDGLGLASFIPLIELSDQTDTDNLEGYMKTAKELFDFIGIPLKFITMLSILVFLFSAKGLIKFMALKYQVKILQRFVKKIRLETFSIFHKISFENFTQFDVGRIQNTFTTDVGRVSQAARLFFKIIEGVTFVAVYFIMAFITNPQFSGLILIGALATNFIYQIIYRKTKSQSTVLVKRNSFYQGMVVQYINLFKYIKASGIIHQYSAKIKQGILNVENTNKRLGILNAIGLTVREPLMVFILALVMMVQFYILKLSISLIIVPLLFFFRALQKLSVIQNNLNGFYGLKGSLKNVKDFQKKLKKSKRKEGKVKLQNCIDKIVLSNVGYESNGLQILKNISLEINQGDSIALVGESGSGKTTLLNIINGLLPASEGIVKVNDVEMSKLKLENYQQRLGYINQETTIFSDSLYNNITLWDERTPENIERFYDAIHLASLDLLIKKQGFNEDSMLEFGGVNISGGQRQRVAIARELYKSPDLYLFDEATSALDSKTEKIVQNKINQMIGKKTIIAVAHRLTTVQDFKIIIELEKGSIKNIIKKDFI